MSGEDGGLEGSGSAARVCSHTLRKRGAGRLYPEHPQTLKTAEMQKRGPSRRQERGLLQTASVGSTRKNVACSVDAFKAKIELARGESRGTRLVSRSACDFWSRPARARGRAARPAARRAKSAQTNKKNPSSWRYRPRLRLRARAPRCQRSATRHPRGAQRPRRRERREHIRFASVAKKPMNTQPPPPQ